jgi:cytochrome c
MKKVFIVLFISAVITACGGPKTNSDGSTGSNETAKAAQSSANTTANKTGTESGSAPAGAALMAKLDCNTCHKENEKVIGPALKDIAAKYQATEANIDALANKVIRGGKGNWGDIPMAAHPTLAVNDAKEMVKYILSLKK